MFVLYDCFLIVLSNAHESGRKSHYFGAFALGQEPECLKLTDLLASDGKPTLVQVVNAVSACSQT